MAPFLIENTKNCQLPYSRDVCTASSALRNAMQLKPKGGACVTHSLTHSRISPKYLLAFFFASASSPHHHDAFNFFCLLHKALCRITRLVVKTLCGLLNGWHISSLGSILYDYQACSHLIWSFPICFVAVFVRDLVQAIFLVFSRHDWSKQPGEQTGISSIVQRTVNNIGGILSVELQPVHSCTTIQPRKQKINRKLDIVLNSSY